jgi:hypothetical protein
MAVKRENALQPINQSTNRTTNQATNQPNEQSINQCIASIVKLQLQMIFVSFVAISGFLLPVRV